MNKNHKKVAILTLNGYYNYGNKLQNYALEQFLIKLGMKPTTVLVRREILLIDILRSRNIKDFFILLRKFIFKKYKNLFLWIFNYKKASFEHKRFIVFKSFSHKMLSEADLGLSFNNIPKDLTSKFKYFITGSDQVWNPYYFRGKELYYLNFAPKEKSISYAASFGVDKIPEDKIKLIKEWLLNCNHISVREEKGAEIVLNLIGKRPPVLLDPTLLISKNEWLKISTKSIYKPNNNYLLTFFLGKITKENRLFINKIKTQFGINEINLNAYNNLYYVSPGEFIDFINSATLMITDSFHGTVFSIILETPFIVCKRQKEYESGQSRFDTLLQRFGFTNRMFEECLNNKNLLEIDFSFAKEKINKEINKTHVFFNEAFLNNEQ